MEEKDVELESVTKKFGDFVAVNDISFAVKKGEFFSLLGPSGCGKTTALRMIAGFEKPTTGTIYIGGEVVNEVPPFERACNLFFQKVALFPHLNVYENIAFGLKVKKISKDQTKQRVLEIAEKVELSREQLTKKVSELSGGQQQRVAIARALILEPSILCLDEPLSNLDAKLRVQLRNQLKELQKKVGITTIYVTHDQEEALTLSNQIAVFNAGLIEQIGTPQEIYNESKTEFVCTFIGDINFLEKELIQEINHQTGSQLNPEKNSYIRTERLSLVDESYNNHKAIFKATLTDVEFYGLYAKYSLESNKGKIKLIDMLSGNRTINIGDSLMIAVDPADIMQY